MNKRSEKEGTRLDRIETILCKFPFSFFAFGPYPGMEWIRLRGNEFPERLSFRRRFAKLLCKRAWFSLLIEVSAKSATISASLNRKDSCKSIVLCSLGVSPELSAFSLLLFLCSFVRVSLPTQYLTIIKERVKALENATHKIERNRTNSVKIQNRILWQYIVRFPHPN